VRYTLLVLTTLDFLTRRLQRVHFRSSLERSPAQVVEFQIKESVRFRRCTFDNFPFASDKEIRTFIAGKIPLYDGFAPDSGNMLDAISTSLEALANSKGISATVTHLPYTKLGTGDFEYLFKLSGPSIKIANVRFTGAQSVPESELPREAQPLRGRDYSDVICREFSLTRLFPITVNGVSSK
jgi:hypothetical protein